MKTLEDLAEAPRPQVRPWSWGRFGCLVMDTVAALASQVASACGEAARAVEAHVAYRADRRRFVASVISDIDSISTGNPVGVAG